MPIVSNTVPNVALPSTGVAPATPQGVDLTDTAAPLPVEDTGNVQTAGVSSADAALPTTAQPDASGVVSDAGDAPTPDADKPELTTSQKLAAKLEAKRKQYINLGAEIERLEAQARSADLLDQVKAGSIIKARVGRAETAKEVTASVLGIQTLDNGDLRYKVYYGEGFDADTVIIQTSQIVDIVQV